jgi:hypothetical protein
MPLVISPSDKNEAVPPAPRLGMNSHSPTRSERDRGLNLGPLPVLPAVNLSAVTLDGGI